jgi:hypothetical protein
VSRCGAKAKIADGLFVALQPDPSHPTGQALCVKGKAAPEHVYHAERLLYPLRRTNPKGSSDPGWQRIAWDEALDIVATRLLGLASHYGPEALAFSSASPSTSAMSDSLDWVMRLRRALAVRTSASIWSYAAGVVTSPPPTPTARLCPGAYMPATPDASTYCGRPASRHDQLLRLAHRRTLAVPLRSSRHDHTYRSGKWWPNFKLPWRFRASRSTSGTDHRQDFHSRDEDRQL